MFIPDVDPNNFLKPDLAQTSSIKPGPDPNLTNTPGSGSATLILNIMNFSINMNTGAGRRRSLQSIFGIQIRQQNAAAKIRQTSQIPKDDASNPPRARQKKSVDFSFMKGIIFLCILQI